MNDINSQLIELLDPDMPDERCGFVLKDGSLVEVKDIHEEPQLGFHMDPAELILYVDAAAATWHTHPQTSPNLSQDDYAGFLAWPNLQHHIVGRTPTGIEIRTYVVEDGVLVHL